MVSGPSPSPSASASASASAAAPVASASTSASAPEPTASASAAVPVDPRDLDPMTLHVETKAELLALFSIVRPPKPDSNADAFIDKSFDTDGPFHINQGNKELAKHAISRAKCMEGLAGITLQTPEQRELCGADNMVPFYKKGDLSKAKACIDIFEFPNKACELPMVWVSPVQAKTVCELQGKRICAQDEWMLACGGDPEGGKPWKYSYGDTLDLDACNTSKSAAVYGPGCEPSTSKSTWKTCATNTEPTGAFPRCRSRFGVFDLQGNVAEEMVRYDPEEQHLMSQLKGSAFFYVDVARDENGRFPKQSKRKKGKEHEQWKETYPDICTHDPRWHVEPIGSAWHVNYHLGFRCCKSIPKASKDGDEKGKNKGKDKDDDR